MLDSIFVYDGQILDSDAKVIIFGCLDSAREFAMRLLNHDIQFDYFLCPTNGNYFLPHILNKPVISFEECRRLKKCVIAVSWMDLENAKRILTVERLDEHLVEIEYLNPVIKRTSTLVVWGTGSRAEHFCSKYGDCFNIKYFCDSNKKKTGSYFKGKEIIHFSTLESLPEDTVVIIASTAYREIAVEAIKCNIKENNIICIRYELSDFVISPDEDNFFSYKVSDISNLIRDCNNENVILYGETGLVKEIAHTMEKLDFHITKVVGRGALKEDGTIYNLLYTIESNETVVLADNPSDDMESMLEQMGITYIWLKSYNGYQIWGDKEVSQLLDPNLGYSFNRQDEAHMGFVKFEYIGESLAAPVRIVLLGGSTTSAFSIRNKCWGEFLSEKLKMHGVPHIIYCGGIQGYRVSQELIKAVRDVLSLKPDLVISYSGVNEIDLRKSDLLKYPFISFYQMELFHKMGEIKNPGSREGVTWGLENTMGIFDYWYTMERILNAVCKELRVSFKAFLQPMLYTKAKCCQADADIAVLYGYLYDMDKMEFIAVNNEKSSLGELELAKDFRDRGQQIDGPWFCDLSSIFDNEENIYMDLCHVYEKGNQIIAARIFEEIRDELYVIIEEKGRVDGRE